MNFGERLKALRISKGFTQLELSEKSGVTLRTVQRIERNEVKPSIHSLNALGKTLETDLTALYPLENHITENYKDMESKNEDLWERAVKRAKVKKGLMIYVLVHVFLWGIWLMNGDKFSHGPSGLPWPIWSMLGWGLGLAIRFVSAYFIHGSEQKEYDKLSARK